MRDPYEILGVPPTASAETIKAAYRKAARLYHPDKNPSADASARFREVQKAFETLADPDQKASLDRLRQRNLIDDPQLEATLIWNTYIDRLMTS